MKQFIKEHVQAGELAVYEVLNQLAPVYNQEFSVLELPTALEIDHEAHRLVLPFYDGEDYATRWSEADGGSGIELSLATEFTQVLGELSKLPTDKLGGDFIFDAERSKKYFSGLVDMFHGAGLLNEEEQRAIEEILSIHQSSPIILNNGDFYPRNFIRRPDGKLLLLDWETWNDHSPFFTIDHPENVAAVMYVHMWGNPKWQAAFRRSLFDDLGLDKQAFRKGVVMKALQLANLWHTRGESTAHLVANQIALVKGEFGL